MDNDRHPIIFFCPGPEYLFYNTGIYCVWELFHLYRIVLLLDYPFNDLTMLQRLKNENIIYDFVSVFHRTKYHIPLVRAFMTHRHYYRISKVLFEKYKPISILQYTDIEPINIYLFEEAGSRKKPRIAFKAGMVCQDTNADYTFLKTQHIKDIAIRYRIPSWLASVFHPILKIFSYYLNYSILPLIIKGHIFKPRINPIPIRGRWFNNRCNYFDYNLTFTEQEKRHLLNSGESSTAVKLFPNRYAHEVHNFIYGPIEEKNEILFLPTDTEILYFKRSKRITDKEAIRQFSDKWLEFSNILQNKFPSFKMYIKLRPIKSSENLLKEVIKSLLQRNERIEIIPSETLASKLILRAKVIVTCFSSVLWWAKLLETKKVLISLNLFNALFGDCFAHTDGIYYFKDLKSLAEFDFSQVPCQKSEIEPSVTLTEFVSNKLKDIN